MSARPPIILDHVWKRYRIGSKHDSLRDAIPAFLRRLTERDGHGLQEGEFWALKDVSFEVANGRTLGIVGPNGAGKSTILKLLSKITKQTKGAIKTNGRLAALIELGGGFHPDLTGLENIYLQGTMLGLRSRHIRRLFDSIVDFSELEPFLQTPVKRYSSGMVVRLGFAVAAQVRPDVLLIDEILAVGDLAFQQKCFKRIAELKADGTTMVFISHNLQAVQKLCDRVLLLKEGRVLGEGDPAAMIRRYREEVLTRRLQPASIQVGKQIGPLRIIQVTLRDANGQVIESLDSGCPLWIEIAYEAVRPITKPLFQVEIERLDGLLCHATSSHTGGLTLDSVTGKGMVTLNYSALNLLPNLYQVTVEVFQETNPIPLASVSHGCFFQVTSDHHERGAVHLDHRWALQNVEWGAQNAK